MSNYLMKTVAKKIFNEQTSNNLAQSDPMYVQTEVRQENGKTKLVKQKKPVPEKISQHNAKILNRVRRRAYRLDKSINICGIRFGVGSVIGVIPVVGDFADFLLAYSVVRLCEEVKPPLPSGIWGKMMGNCAFDWALGLLPLVGDLCDALYKANSKNAAILEEVLNGKQYEVGTQANIDALRAATEKEAGKKAGKPTAHSNQPIQAHDQPNQSHQQQPQHNDMTELGPPPRYESGLGGRNMATHNDVLNAPPATPSKQKSTGGSWLGRFSSNRKSENDLERGEMPPMQPARPVGTIRS